MCHILETTDGEEVLRKYHINTVKGMCKITQDHGHSFNIHVIEKVHSDEKFL